MSVKVFTIEEAEAMLPQVQEQLVRVQDLDTKIQAQQSEIDLAEILQSDVVDRPGDVLNASPQLESAVATYNALLEEQRTVVGELMDLGCQIKDVQAGLVDFFTLHGNELVYLCWKQGEPSIGFWHTLDGGFQGRQPIEQLDRGTKEG